MCFNMLVICIVSVWLQSSQKSSDFTSRLHVCLYLLAFCFFMFKEDMRGKSTEKEEITEETGRF